MGEDITSVWSGPWISVCCETVPLIKRLQDSPVSPADADDQAFQLGTAPCRLTSSATVRERRRCLSAEDHTPPGLRTPSSRVPGREDSVARSPRERCHSSNESTGRAPTEASSSVSNFLSPSTTSTTTATPSSTSSSPARRASYASPATIFDLARFLLIIKSVSKYPLNLAQLNNQSEWE